MTKQEAYLLVYKDLMQNPMFRGFYDARNGNEHYMYGISSVMEHIAWNAGGDELVDEYNTYWSANMESSEAIAELSRKIEEREKQSHKFEKEYNDYEETHVDN